MICLKFDSGLHFRMSIFEVVFEVSHCQVGVRNLLTVQFNVGDLALLAHLWVVDVLVGKPGQTKPHLELDAER